MFDTNYKLTMIKMYRKKNLNFPMKIKQCTLIIV